MTYFVSGGMYNLTSNQFCMTVCHSIYQSEELPIGPSPFSVHHLNPMQSDVTDFLSALHCQRPLIKTKWSGWERVNVLLDVYCIILERSRNQVLFMFVIVWHSWLNVSSVSLFLRRRCGHFVGPGDICLLLADVSQSSFCPVTDWTTNEGPCCTAVCRRLAQIAPETVSAYLRCIWFT